VLSLWLVREHFSTLQGSYICCSGDLRRLAARSQKSRTDLQYAELRMLSSISYMIETDHLSTEMHAHTAHNKTSTSSRADIYIELVVKQQTRLASSVGILVQ
jgi:hypothetical protein